MHWIGLALLALVAGIVNTKVTPLVANAVPGSASQNFWIKSFVSGALILLTVFVAVFALSIIGVKTARAA
jgi:hypothetical protein